MLDKKPFGGLYVNQVSLCHGSALDEGWHASKKEAHEGEKPMKRLKDWSFRSKITMSGLAIGLITILIMIGMLAATTLGRIREGNRSSLELLTEQIVINFSSAANDAVHNVYTMCSGSGVPGKLYSMRNLSPSSTDYMLSSRDVTNLLMFMVTGGMPYDRVSVLPDGAEQLIHGDVHDAEAISEAEEIFADPQNRENTYNHVSWNRLEDGSLWLIRDIYNTSPLRHVGKIAVRVRQEELISIGEQNASRRITVLFYNQAHELIAAVGERSSEVAEIIGGEVPTETETIRLGSDLYAVSTCKSGKWLAVGLQPMSVVDELTRPVIRIAVLAVIVALLIAIFLSRIVSRGISRGIDTLVDSMNQFAEGNLETQALVESRDEIGELAARFNQMTGEMKNLLKQLVQEETEKNQAEYRNIEYEYRFLQWQVHPHFIYNALETINGMAKLDGSEDVCDMIQSLSGYFRHNAETMRKRFVTVRQELRSLRQYVEIYRRIYGADLRVEYLFDSETGAAYLPTMTVQPLLENALIHGVRFGQEAVIRVVAETSDDQLEIRIEDNGPGMTEETVTRILGPRNDSPQNKEEKTSLGVRNVLDRLKLLFGDQAGLSIESVLGEGTVVTMRLPLSFTEGSAELVKR